MKKIGLIGGVSWVSTVDYYRFINEEINKRLGGLNFAELVLYSLNFGEVQRKGWLNSFDLLMRACHDLERTGVSGIALCANTAHLFADDLQKNISVPLIHIGTETANAIKNKHLNQVGLLATLWTMEMSFYKDKLSTYGLRVTVPDKEDRDYIQHTLKEELGRGILNEATRQKYISIANQLVDGGAQGIILGCTEIPLLINETDFTVPVFDTTKIHVEAIVDFMLRED